MLRNRLEVVFRFPGQVTEIRYLGLLPKVGEMIELRGGSWRVAHVQRNRSGVGFEVLCERLPNHRRVRDLADDLLRMVRRQSPERGRED